MPSLELKEKVKIEVKGERSGYSQKSTYKAIVVMTSPRDKIENKK